MATVGQEGPAGAVAPVTRRSLQASPAKLRLAFEVSIAEVAVRPHVLALVYIHLPPIAVFADVSAHIGDFSQPCFCFCCSAICTAPAASCTSTWGLRTNDHEC